MASNTDHMLVLPQLQGSSPMSTTTANPQSSPSMPYTGRNSKARRGPNITPNSFRRFFSPRSSGSGSSSAGRALRDLTASATNNRNNRHNANRGANRPFTDISRAVGENGVVNGGRDGRKRQSSASPNDTTSDTLPDRHNVTKRAKVLHPIGEDSEENGGGDINQQLARHAEEIMDHRVPSLLPRKPRPQTNSSLSVRLLDRSLGLQSFGCKIQFKSHHCADWRDETRNFYSRPDDRHSIVHVTDPEKNSLPFCTASCNTNTLVAIGDQDGGIRLLETAKHDKVGFKIPYLTFQPHNNAVLDLAFSPSDWLLASASGDQSCCIIDMRTQQTISVLSAHTASVKQVRWQPGSASESVLATSSRDGTVQIWDLRCSGIDGPLRNLHVDVDGSLPSAKLSKWARPVSSIFEAHADGRPPQIDNDPSTPTNSRSDPPTRRGDVSVTALSFLPEGREHLLITASEANACIKLWDLRVTHNNRRGRALPLSTTRQPDAHTSYRQFGTNSLNLSGDGNRIYSLCRDNTIYAYSTSHLILGHAPELSGPASSRPRRSAAGREKEGLGPLYGFRHPRLHATSFYVKSAIRLAVDDKREMLAVSSSDGCAVVFPTDERFMDRSLYPIRLSTDESDTETSVSSQTPDPRRPTVSRSPSSLLLARKGQDTIPIYNNGSALLRGHNLAEVTGLAWTSRGELVTVGDDFAARCWREDGDFASDMRRGGETGGRRWGWGWAEVDGKEDESDSECD